MRKIVIADVFTRTPGPRNQQEGDFSGEQFLKEHLEPGFVAAKIKNESLLIDLDGTEASARAFVACSGNRAGAREKFGRWW